MSVTPKPGQPVRGSTTGRPVMAALDLLGRRWALRLIWELRDDPVGARDLRQRCDGMSSSVLYDRLKELGEAGLLEKDDQGRYRLSEIGSTLGAAILPLIRWSDDWQATQKSRPGRGY